MCNMYMKLELVFKLSSEILEFEKKIVPKENKKRKVLRIENCSLNNVLLDQVWQQIAE